MRVLLISSNTGPIMGGEEATLPRSRDVPLPEGTGSGGVVEGDPGDAGRTQHPADGFLLLGGPDETRVTVECRAGGIGFRRGRSLLPAFYLAPGLGPWLHEGVARVQAC